MGSNFGTSPDRAHPMALRRGRISRGWGASLFASMSGRPRLAAVLAQHGYFFPMTRQSDFHMGTLVEEL